MRDLAFFEQVDRLQKDCRGRAFRLPVFYYDVSAIMAAFLTPLEKVRALIGEGKREGAKAIRDGSTPRDPDLARGYFVEPTIFSSVDPSMRIATEEIFGPVISVIPADDLDGALAAANAVGYGLSSSIYTRDLRTAFRYADESEAGMLHVNLPTPGGEAHVPFGGVKDSGFGDRECGTAAFDFFTETRVVYVGY